MELMLIRAKDNLFCVNLIFAYRLYRQLFIGFFLLLLSAVCVCVYVFSAAMCVVFDVI